MCSYVIEWGTYTACPTCTACSKVGDITTREYSPLPVGFPLCEPSKINKGPLTLVWFHAKSPAGMLWEERWMHKRHWMAPNYTCWSIAHVWCSLQIVIDNLIRSAHQFLISTHLIEKRWETKSTTGNGATQAGSTSTCHLSPLVFVAPKPLLRELIVTQQMQLVRQLVPWRRRPRRGHSHAWFGSRSFGVCHLGISEEPCVKSKLTT